ncbi:MAG: (2E,6E)-farnesyl diphosphate synthase [Candidatus Heimdallarchaeota archaeon LC_2]|nr:MAG: (2E,6E)-farnesyl diphosphate synthase [Candidatus Heimdallarchaeota archaeon LC_2]
MDEIETKTILQKLVSFQSQINELLDHEMKKFLAPLNESIREILKYYYDLGGKKMRPALFLAVAQAFESQENLAPHALALELIHTMSLYHDDVIDHAKERRGAPTVHEKWNTATAIVGGDILHTLIHGHILRSIENKHIKYPDLALKFMQDLIYNVEIPIGSAVIDEMRLSESNEIPTLSEAMKATVGKTAPLFAFSASAGAYISGQSKQISEDMFDMGMHLGQAFQLLDDLNDYFKSDKDIGGDLREDKKTPFLILAYEKNPQLVQSYRERRDNLSDQDIKEFRESFKDEMKTVLDWSEKHINSAKQFMAQIPNNTTKEYILALFKLMKLKVKEITETLDKIKDNGL